MSLFGALRAGTEAKSRGALTEFLPGWLDGGRSTKSGQSVNWKTALEVTTVLACCKVLCEGVAQVPWKLRRLRADQVGADDARNDPRFRLLHRKPNSFQTSFEFRETIMLHLAIVQNAYVFKNRVGGRLYELIPLDPTRCKPEQLADLSVVYDVTGRDGKTVRLGQKDIWHLRGLSWDGVIGLETIKLAREALGLSLALEEAHARLHENGVQPSGIYSMQGVIDETQHTKLAAWIKRHAAAQARGNPLILDNGATWLTTQMSGVDSEHLATRRFQIEEICRAFRVMPIMVMQSDKAATYASAEQMFLAHVTHTLGPWYERIEQSADVNLIGDEESDLFTQFDPSALTQGTFKERQEALQIQWRAGSLSADEWRASNGRNPRPDGKGGEFFTEVNMGSSSAPPEPGSGV